jgi:hypothetical protein
MSLDYAKADSMLQGRCRESRKLGNNTYLLRGNKEIAVKLHATHILTFYPNGSIRVATGGWNTVTTKARINEYIPQPWSVGSCSSQYGDNCVLYRYGVGAVAIVDTHFVIPANGNIPKYVTQHVEKVKKQTRDQINANNRLRSKQRYWINKARTGEPTKKPLTLAMIQDESNVTIRTAMIKVYGIERFLTQVDSKILDVHGDYQLLSYSLDNWQHIRALKMVCPSTKTVYIHPVEPRCESVSKALDWMFQTENYLERLQVEA